MREKSLIYSEWKHKFNLPYVTGHLLFRRNIRLVQNMGKAPKPPLPWLRNRFQFNRSRRARQNLKSPRLY